MESVIIDKHSEYPRAACLDYKLDLVANQQNFNTIFSETFNWQWDGAVPFYLVHPFDLILLKNYIRYNNVTSVTELGCGSSSRFMDRICKVKRTSFASEDMNKGGIKYIDCNIFESHDEILKSCQESQLFFIDAIHSTGIAEFYLDILRETKIPVFIHDWYLPGEETWPEQNYWVENILDKYYTPYIVARGLDSCPLESMVNGGIPPCSAILKSI